MSVEYLEQGPVPASDRARPPEPDGWAHRWLSSRRLPSTLVTLVLHAGLVVVLWQTNLLPWHPTEEPEPVLAVLVQQPENAMPAEIPRPPDIPPPVMASVLLDLPVVEGPSSAIRAAATVPVPVRGAVEVGTGPVALSTELSVACPERVAPHYPAEAKRRREQGTVVLRVELDEHGRVAEVTVLKPSGSRALDEAGASAVRGWRCNPAERDGRAVRAVATQALDFVLERR